MTHSFPTRLSSVLLLRCEKGVATVALEVGPGTDARVTGLRIANFEMADDSFDKVAAEIAALPGRTGFLVAKLDGGTVKPIASAHSDEQFAVGSIVQLYIDRKSTRLNSRHQCASRMPSAA